ncbi:hypothetical membrane protein [Cenarchaeum symbiosum A]|uniref:Hypothetical membrane protein n=1 Tax=Cenarchaeum symbiosum (strain A) TaxID=414004 RepID=A0RTP2_CENSY|nr:hypothetical membrane protein [Cenarchaeum symbiosum A]
MKPQIISPGGPVHFMALIWIAVGVGIAVILVLILKIIQTPRHKAVSVDYYCKMCGEKTNGLKCPRCSKNDPFGR